MEFIKSLYQDEINSYENQISNLKSQMKESEAKNDKLVERVKQLESLIDKAHDTNKDLHSAFEHVRKENLQLQLHPAVPTTSEIACADDNLNLANGLQWISDKDRLTQRVKFLERECERYNRDNCTLSKQVRHLIRTLEEERGMIIRSRLEPTPKRTRGMTTAIDVIDDHLVTFESIAELQDKNQKLLSMIKELGQREEERETKIDSDEMKQLISETKSLRTQLESVKEDRLKALEAFDTILKERDLFKILLCKTEQAQHMTPVIFQKMVSVACSSFPAILDQPEAIEDKSSEVKDMISKLEQQVAALRSEKEAAHQKIETELKLKSSLLEEAQLKILAMSEKIEALNAQNSLLTENVSTLMDEIDELRTSRQKLTFDLDRLREDHSALATQAQRAETELKLKSGLLAEAQLKNDALRNEMDELEAQNSGTEDRMGELVEMTEALKNQNSLLTENVNSLMEELEELRNSHQGLLYDHDNLREDYSSLSTQAQGVEDELKLKSGLLAEAQLKIVAMSEKIEELRASENISVLVKELVETCQANQGESMETCQADRGEIVETSQADQGESSETCHVDQSESSETCQARPGIVLKRRKF